MALCATVTATAVALPGSVQAMPKTDLDSAQRKVETLYHQAEKATERYNDARIALKDAERRFGQAQRRATAQQAAVSELQRAVGAYAAESYRNGGVDRTLQLVFSEDPEVFLDRAASLEALSAREAATLRKVVEARRELRANQAAAGQQLAAVEKQRKALAAEKVEVERNLREARSVLNRLEEKDRERMQRASRSGDSRALLEALPAPDTKRAAIAIQFALKQIGDRYVWGASGPDGWDCSGLTSTAWGKAGVSLPHSSSQQFSSGKQIPRSELAPGDLVYFYSPISHVGLYLGNGKMVHAPNPSRSVEISPISQMPYAGATRP